MNTLVYRYGLRAPHENRDLALSELRTAHEYRNKLIEIECARRKRVRAAEDALLGKPRLKLAEAQVALDAAIETVSKHRAGTRKRATPAEMLATLKTAREAQHAASKAFRLARQLVQPRCADCRKKDLPTPCEHATQEGVGLLAELDAAQDEAKEAVKKFRKEEGPYWGSYLLADKAAGQSFSELTLYDIDGKPNDPRFVRWTGEGTLGVQLQGGLSVEAALAGQDTQLRISAPPVACWDPSTGSRRARSRQSRESEVWLRQGSVGRAPIWCKFGLHMQRPLPPGAQIMWAEVHCRRVGPHFDWYLTLTLRVDDAVTLKPRIIPTRDAVAIDVGWRVFGEGETYELRVAYWSDGSNDAPVVIRERDIRVPGFVLPPRGELRLDTATLNQLVQPDGVRAERDVLLDGIRARLVSWLKQEHAAIPDWLREHCKTLHAWRSKAKFASLTGRWGEWLAEHPDGEKEAYDALVAWRGQDRYLWAVESRWRDRALLRRRELYRLFGVALARTYSTVVLEKFDKREIAKRPKTEEDGQSQPARSNRQLAAVSELCECVAEASTSRGRTVVEVPCENSTRECPVCGCVDERNAARRVTISCACGHVWDQDDGAADTLLGRWRERPGDAKMAGAPLKPKILNGDGSVETRMQRAKRKGAEKVLRKMERSKTGT
jgi:hypothetical protein